MNWVSENRILVVGLAIVVGFLGFALFRNNQSASDSTQASYKQVDASSAMIKGDTNAPVSLIQYSDFICPSCSYLSTQIMPTIEKEYINTGKVKFEFRPMAFIDDGSTQAGMGGYCAIDQDKFWQYHDAIYTVVADKVYNQGLDPKQGDTILTATDVKTIAQTAGLESQSFNTCLESNKHGVDITRSTTTANKNGVTGTPYLMVNGQVYQGDMTLSSIEALIKANL